MHLKVYKFSHTAWKNGQYVNTGYPKVQISVERQGHRKKSQWYRVLMFNLELSDNHEMGQAIMNQLCKDYRQPYTYLF